MCFFFVFLQYTRTTPNFKHMRKIALSIVIAFSAFSMQMLAQVGINTAIPASTLEVVAKNPTGISTGVDGLLIPRVDRQRAQDMTSIPTSTLIYINSIATGTATGIAANIDAVGYYFYDGAIWTKMPVNLYNSNGTLTGNRTVTQGASTLAFNATATNAFSVDGTSFSVDAANHRIGIGTTAPENRFQVVSTAAITNRYTLFDAPAGTNQFVILALRNTSPVATGNYSLLGFSNSGATSGGAAWGIGSVRTATAEEFFLGNSLGGAYLERFRVTTGGLVGIGTSVPTSLLSVNGTADKVGGGTWGTFSDSRMKKNVQPYTKGLPEILKINTVTFQYNGKGGYPDDGKTYTGVIAQEIEKVLPGTVTKIKSKDFDDQRKYDSSEIMYTLINAVKEQQKLLEEQDRQIKELKTDIMALKAKKK
jgi:hypothetical protein